ncbi:MAG: hypothetical protein JKY60_13015 [Kordiimonadaceae bacterium]|nr:hypothetical protein [Kordiimonadaceae bacterium]
MKMLISLDTVQKIKRELGRTSPSIKSSHRVEAMARGLGWKSNAALRACLMCSSIECEIDDTEFCNYLKNRGFENIASDALSKAISNVGMQSGQLHASATKRNNQGRQAFGIVGFFAGKVSLAAAFVGFLCAVFYLYNGAQTAVGRLDSTVEHILTVAEGTAKRSVLVFDEALASEVAGSLLAFPYIKKASIFDDHGVIIATVSRAKVTDVSLATISSLFASLGDKTYARVLVLPSGLDGNAELRLIVDQRVGLTMVPGPTMTGFFMFFLIGATLIFAFAALSRVLRKRVQAYLIELYRYQKA